MSTVHLFGNVRVEQSEGYTVTLFEDGTKVHAIHGKQPGQEYTAWKIGLAVEEMNRGHDLMHSRLASMLGLPYSPALWSVAHKLKGNDELHGAEEDAVIAIQRFGALLGR